MQYSDQPCGEVVTTKPALTSEDPEATSHIPALQRPILRGRLLASESEDRNRSHITSKKVSFADLDGGQPLHVVFEFEKQDEINEGVVKRSVCCAVW